MNNTPHRAASEKILGKTGVVGRFKPLHNGGALMLEAVCRNAEHVTIGIGSANKYNHRNPFTAEESAEMVNALLSGRFANYTVVPIPDFAHIPEYRDGKHWKEYLAQAFGPLDSFVSGNEYLQKLLSDRYRIVEPASLIPREQWTQLRSTAVRIAMAQNADWKSFVPAAVADYLEKNNLVQRFQNEFGLQTIAMLSDNATLYGRENAEAEALHAQEI